MNKKYWEAFYEQQKPTEFAQFCRNYLSRHSRLIDLGCGNGRDSYYFAKKGMRVVGIDYAFAPMSNDENPIFIQDSLEKILKDDPCRYDVVYSRFFLHAINKHQIKNLIAWTGTIRPKGLFMAEFRDSSDEPILFKNHKRTKVDTEKLLEQLHQQNFSIVYNITSRGFAKFKNENPLIIRIIGVKNA
jgi:SAM-dependent methyltransferase